MTDWPPRWTGPHFKGAGSRKVARGLKRETRLAGENAHKKQVRTRDKFCRFPLCGCSRFSLRLEVSHAKHKGMGGNPKADRSEPELMVLVCSARHKENVFSIDRGTLRWRPLTDKGSAGPIAWSIALFDLLRVAKTEGSDLLTLALADIKPRTQWFELARERSIHTCEPSTPAQSVILAWLRGMEK